MSERSYYYKGKYVGSSYDAPDPGLEFQAIASFFVVGLIIVGALIWGVDRALQLAEEETFRWDFLVGAIIVYVIIDIIVSLFTSLSDCGDVFEFDDPWKYLAAFIFSTLITITGTIIVIVSACDYLSPNKFAYFSLTAVIALVLAGITPGLCVLLKEIVPYLGEFVVLLAKLLVKIIWKVLKPIWEALVRTLTFS